MTFLLNTQTKATFYIDAVSPLSIYTAKDISTCLASKNVFNSLCLHGCGKKESAGGNECHSEYPPTEICTSATILCGRRKGKGSPPSLATACITSSQRRRSGSGFSRARRFAVGTVRMRLSVASSPHGPGCSWRRLFHSSWDVSPMKKGNRP